MPKVFYVFSLVYVVLMGVKRKENPSKNVFMRFFVLRDFLSNLIGTTKCNSVVCLTK